MNRLRPHLAPPTPAPGEDSRVIRRFFALIERLERPFRKPEDGPAPEVKARITAIIDEPNRPH